MKKFNFELEPGKKLISKVDVSAINERPLVTIITAFYNAAQYFEQTFNCVENQTFPWFEWIIVNDGSTNKKDVDFLNEITKTDKRIKIINQKNMGATGARKNGINNSSTDIIVFLDADDLIDCRYIEMVYWGLYYNEEAKWAYSDSVGFGEQNYEWVWDFSSDVMKHENILPYCSAIRKEVLTDDTYDTTTKNNWEDWQLWLKLLAKNYRPYRIKKELFWYRRCNNGMLAKIEKDAELKKSLNETINALVAKVPDGITGLIPDMRKQLEFGEINHTKWDRKLPYKDKKINILFLLPHMECGGADKFNLDVITNLDKAKYEIGIISTVDNESEWEQEFSKEIEDVFELPKFLSKKDWLSFIYYYIISRDVDIILNISSYWGYYALPLIKIDFPHVAVIDCVHAEGKYWRMGGYPRISGKVSSLIEKTFVTNDFTRNILVNKYGTDYEKTQVIYTGVDKNIFSREKIDCNEEAEKYSISLEKPSVLYLCRLCPEKRPFLMLDIADKVRNVLPDIQFLAVGGGEYLEELKEKAREMNLEKNVIFTGRVKDTKPFYKMADIFLLCSLKEGLSVTTLEAMSMGLPVISADVGSQYELVNDETGKLIKCRADEEKDFYNKTNDREEVEEYAAAIIEQLKKIKENEEKVRTNCINKIESGFTLNHLIMTLDKEFGQLVSDESIKKRVEANKDLTDLRGVFEELFIMYQSYESKELESSEIWQAKEYFYQQYVGAKENGMVCAGEKNRLEDKLNEIYSSRSWKLIIKYKKFMDLTSVGHFLSKIRNRIFK